MDWYAIVPGQKARIRFKANVVATFEQHRQVRFLARERGGLLFADSSLGGPDEVVVSDATPPNRRDRATRCSLDLDHGRCQSEIACANRQGIVFVGYWHTHAEDRPEISPQDISSLFANLRQRQAGLSRMLAVIIGRSPGVDGVSGYLLEADKRNWPFVQPLAIEVCAST